MSFAFRRQFKALADSVPQYPQANRDQLWRNVATELSHRQAVAKSRGSGRFRALWLAGVVSFAFLLVVLPPLFNQSHTSLGGYLMRTQLLEAAPRRERSVVVGWGDGGGQEIVGFRHIASNPGLELFLHEDGMRFLIRHKSSGRMWTTSPDVRDARVSAEYSGRLNSPFSIRYGDESGRVDAWANPADHVSFMEYYPISGGVGIRFVFESLAIAVRIDYQLGEGYLQVSIPEGGIEEYGTYRVKAIELFPFFDVWGDEEAKRLVMASTVQAVPDLSVQLVTDHAEPQLLFGIVGDGAGFLAEVIEGGNAASVHVDPSGVTIDSQRVYVEFLVGGEQGGASGRQQGGRHTVRYYALTDEHPGMDGAAEMFQRHMKESLGTGRRMVDGQMPRIVTS